MDEVAKGGRTVLFVSHNMAAMTHLCTRGILLRGGYTLQSGDIASTVAAYEASLTGEAQEGAQTHVLYETRPRMTRISVFWPFTLSTRRAVRRKVIGSVG